MSSGQRMWHCGTFDSSIRERLLDMLETSVRLLRLLSLLQVRRNWSGADLASRLKVTTRTVRNDIERLRILGYEVHSSTGVAGGYRLAPGSALPPLLLDDEEAVAVAVGLAAAAAGSVTGIEETSLRAMAKLQQTLPLRLRRRVEALSQATISATGRGPTVDAHILTVIAGACRDYHQLRFDYFGRDDAASRRQVEPHRLVYTGRRWYLLAWDRDREDWRTFRADRIGSPLPTGPTFTPREPPEDPAPHVLRGVGSLAWTHQARIRLHDSAQAIAEILPPEAGLLHPIDEDSCLLETGSDSLHDLVRYLTNLNVGFTVLEPPELRTLLRELADRYATAAAEPPQHRDSGANRCTVPTPKSTVPLAGPSTETRPEADSPDAAG